MKIWPFDPAAEASGGHYISGPDLDRALEPFRKIRGAVGDRMDIMVEFHSMWNLPTAIRIARALEPFDTFWHEDPIKMDALADLATYAAASRAPVCASETLAFRQSFRELLEARAAGIVMLDLSWCGGLSEAKKIATMAEAYHLPVAPHDCTGPVVLAASTHLSCNAPNALIQESVRAFYTGWYQELVTALPEVKDGMIAPPPGPGLGLDLLPDLDRAQGRGRAQQRPGLMLELASHAAALGRTAGDRWRRRPVRLAGRGGAGAAVPPLGRPQRRPEPPRLLSAGALVEPHLRRRHRGGRQVLAAPAELAGRALPDPRRRLAAALARSSGARPTRARLALESTDAAALRLSGRAHLRARRANADHAPGRRASRRVAGALRPRLPPLAAAHTGYRCCSCQRREVWLETADHLPAGNGAGRRTAGLGFRACASAARRPGSTTASPAGTATARDRLAASIGCSSTVAADARALHLHPLFAQSADADFFCFEPVSHPVDAFHLPGMPGLRTLAAGRAPRASPARFTAREHAP